jgi:DNA-binding HxlR family transcriptional regulator
LSALGSTPSPAQSILREVQSASLFLAPVSWVLLGGAWVWRGRVRARYREMGFGPDVFELFMKMKGGATRIRVLGRLNTPKDRLQLAEELGVDWKTVDRHVQTLSKFGFVREESTYGTVRLYQVTPMGKMLLDLFDQLEKTDGPVDQQHQTSRRPQDGV